MPLIDAALRRIDTWSSKSLASVADPVEWEGFSTTRHLADEIHALGLDERQRIRCQLVDTSASPSNLLTEKLVRWIQRRNQFIVVGAAARREIRNIYDVGFSRALVARGFDEVSALLAVHGQAVRSAILEVTGGEPKDVVSGRYSPSTQLHVLGFDTDVRGPVLDIGCGEDLLLVRHLRSRGVQAHGIDRELGGPAHDWLAYDPGVARWETILAHQSFSLHFAHHHLHANEDTALEYAGAYMRYLHALRPGGTFAYAPSMPFIDCALPDIEWEVRTVRRNFDRITTSATRVTRRLW